MTTEKTNPSVPEELPGNAGNEAIETPQAEVKDNAPVTEELPTVVEAVEEDAPGDDVPVTAEPEQEASVPFGSSGNETAAPEPAFPAREEVMEQPEQTVPEAGIEPADSIAEDIEPHSVQSASEHLEPEAEQAREPSAEVKIATIPEASGAEAQPECENASLSLCPSTTEPTVSEAVTPQTQVSKQADGSENAVDFSDEDAELDSASPDFDLGDAGSEEEASHEPSDHDLSGMSKKKLLDLFAELMAAKPVQALRKDVEAIKVAFYKTHRAEVESLRKQFIESGGAPEEFAAPVDNCEQRLKDLFAEYRRRRDEFIANLERSKEDNLKVKLHIIDEMKELVNSNETMNNTFNTFRELQQRWKDAGPVPQANVKDLWETYNHHVENFYSYIKINKELRDLDLKKNYEAKTALCEEAEALILEPAIVNAFYKLQKLHEQWRETGPVANEYKEVLWQRFKEASARINKQHQDYFEGLKEEQRKNLELKTELCEKTEELSEGIWTTSKEWNKASDRLLEIQKIWKTIGFAPKKNNTRIYERFRNACDRFFEQKHKFYVQIKAEMDHNLQLKNEICQAAEAVKESDDWKKTTDELIALQKKWKEIGPVSRRHSDAVWKRFRSACDYFFSRKAEHFSAQDNQQEKNLEQKRALIAEIARCDIESGGFELIKDFQRRWSEIGFVPIKQKKSIQKEYKEAMDRLFAAVRGSDQSRQMDRFRDRVSNMRGGGDRKIRHERDRLYNKVRQLEADIALLENNIGFFSKSKNAEAMIRDVQEKIARAREEMAAAIEKVKIIDSQE